MKSKFSRWMKRIRDTQSDEIDCSACLDQVSHYVDLELASCNAEEKLPQVKQHLDQCGVCSEEYHLLRDLARLEQKGESPTKNELIDQLIKPSD